MTPMIGVLEDSKPYTVSRHSKYFHCPSIRRTDFIALGAKAQDHDWLAVDPPAWEW